jgi:hypothetical protein
MMKDKMLMFREEDTGGSGGGDSKGAAAFEEGGQQQQVTTQEEPKQEEPKAPMVDAAALAEKFGEILNKQQQQPQKELTPEEARKLLKFPEIDDEFMKEFGDIGTQKKAIEKFRDMILTHIHTVNGMTRREMMDEMDGKFKPALEYVTKAEQRERDADFDKSYPALAKPELKPIIKAVQESLKNEKFADEKSHFKAVAEGVAAVIQVHQPNFKLSDGSSPSKTTTKTSSSGGIPVTTGGSGGGGGGGGNQESSKPRGVKIFDK